MIALVKFEREFILENLPHHKKEEALFDETSILYSINDIISDDAIVIDDEDFVYVIKSLEWSVQKRLFDRKLPLNCYRYNSLRGKKNKVSSYFEEYDI